MILIKNKKMKEIEWGDVWIISLIVCFFLGIFLWEYEVITSGDTLVWFVFGIPVAFSLVFCRIVNGKW